MEANPESAALTSPIWTTLEQTAAHDSIAAGSGDSVSVIDPRPTIKPAVPAVDKSWVELLELSQCFGLSRLIYCHYVKHLTDMLVAIAALVMLVPVLLIVAVAIRLESPGPAVFRQARIGRGGRIFIVYKFRTMVDEESGLRLFKGVDGRLRHKIPNDPRITRVGRLLRCTSIDELPQLFNVVRGDMSLVGPRPELPEIVQDYAPWQHQRHLVRPGITGWWQVQGRSDLPMHEHTELDIYYVNNMSLGLDGRILVRTIRAAISGMGAF